MRAGSIASDLTSKRKRDEPPPLRHCRYLDMRDPTSAPAGRIASHNFNEKVNFPMCGLGDMISREVKMLWDLNWVKDVRMKRRLNGLYMSQMLGSSNTLIWYSSADQLLPLLLRKEGRQVQRRQLRVLLDDTSTFTGEMTAGPNANSIREILLLLFLPSAKFLSPGVSVKDC
ncbi:Cationic peroxidase [Arachis hypogaea]|nr:Cationic peroxidase [Arachis hypogaea]